jgi:hypothetical protein
VSKIKIQIKRVIISVLTIISCVPISALTVSTYGNAFLIDNDIYSAVVSTKSGMIESLKIHGNDYEIVSDIPGYSMFFVEYMYEYENGIDFRFDHPDDWRQTEANVNIVYSDTNLCVIEVQYITGFIDSEWVFYFEENVPYIRTTIKRKVLLLAYTVIFNNAPCTIPTWIIRSLSTTKVKLN